MRTGIVVKREASFLVQKGQVHYSRGPSLKGGDDKKGEHCLDDVVVVKIVTLPLPPHRLLRLLVREVSSAAAEKVTIWVETDVVNGCARRLLSHSLLRIVTVNNIDKGIAQTVLHR